MLKASSIVCSAFCLSVVATSCMAASSDNGSTNNTSTQSGSPQVSPPATGDGSVRGSYPATVGPTGSTQPDATNPIRSQPSGGGKS
jgi:hypothetical protein